MELVYYDNIAGTVSVSRFFLGWQSRPSQQTFETMIANSEFVVCAVDAETGEVVGLITAITDKVLSAYVPFLEVDAGYRNMGIGSTLVRRMIRLLNDFYMIDLVCDAELKTFYGPLGMSPGVAMSIRNYARQQGPILNGDSH